MAVCVPYFNPSLYQSRKANFDRFLVRMSEQGVPVYIAELAFGERLHELPPGDRVLHLRTRDVMWHKESLVNVLVRSLPSHYCKVAWVDGDILFANACWYSDASCALDYFELIQPYATVQDLGPSGEVIAASSSLAHHVWCGQPRSFDFSVSRPGLAWAARRELLEAFPLFDRMIVGGGDLLMALAVYGCWEHPYVDRLPYALREHWRLVSRLLWERIQGRVGYVEALLVHLWHGARPRRLYVDRLRILSEHAYDPELDVAIDGQGILAWASRKPGLHEAVRSYFDRRQEDA